MTAPRSAAVVGAGWAGCAAAATLSAAGVAVTVFEAAAELGGRGRRVTLDLGGARHVVDNGQHLMIGAYTAIAALLAEVGVDLEAAVEQRPFELTYADGFRLRAARLPAPWHLAAALLGARGLAWRDRAAMVRLLRTLKADRWQVRPDDNAADWLRRHGQSEALIARVWRPLGIAALNTPLNEASAQIYANVLRDSLGAASGASMLWLPRTDLSALLPEAVERFVLARGGGMRRGMRIAAIHASNGGFRLDPAEGSYDAVVYAAPPSQLPSVAAAFAPHLGEAFAASGRFEYAPICTVYLKYDPPVALPATFLALLDADATRSWGQWVFDRGATDPANRGVFAVVVSARGAHLDAPLAALCDDVAMQLTRDLRLPAPIAARAVVEKRATLAVRPGLVRPPNATAVPGLVLAGDWTASEYPSTLESAVRSGVAAARRLLA